MSRGVIVERNVRRSCHPRRRAISDRSHQVARIVAVRGGSVARVGHDVECVIDIISVSCDALLRRCLVPETTVPIVIEAADLPRLITLCNLIARVVGVTGSCVGRATPIQFFHCREPAQCILRKPPLPPVFVLRGRDFSSRAAASAITSRPLCAVSIGCLSGTPFPIVPCADRRQMNSLSSAGESFPVGCSAEVKALALW